MQSTQQNLLRNPLFVYLFPRQPNRISGVMVSVLVSSAVDRGFEPRSGQTKDYQFGISCFSAKHASLRRKYKDGLAGNQDNVSEWGDTSIRWLLFQWTSTIKKPTQRVGLVQSDIIIISLKINLCVVFAII
jgi:hypothetical protein